MPDYQHGKIYTIRCRSDNTLIYVGSTTMTLSRRIAEHRSGSKTKNMKIYQVVNGKWDDWYIELYEVYPCDNREQLNKREGEVIREIGTLNYRIAGRTPMEWREDNIDKVKLTNQKSRENNAEKIKEQDKLYRENNAEKIKEQSKLYYENNAEKIKKYKQEYYAKQKAKKDEVII